MHWYCMRIRHCWPSTMHLHFACCVSRATNKHAQSTHRIDKITYQPVVVLTSIRNANSTRAQTGTWWIIAWCALMPIMTSNIYYYKIVANYWGIVVLASGGYWTLMVARAPHSGAASVWLFIIIFCGLYSENWIIISWTNECASETMSIIKWLLSFGCCNTRPLPCLYEWLHFIICLWHTQLKSNE